MVVMTASIFISWQIIYLVGTPLSVIHMTCRNESIRVLCVDDSIHYADLLAAHLTDKNDRFVVETAENASDALDRLAVRDIDCLVSDYAMPGMDGIEFLNEVREFDEELPFVLLTGKGSEAVASESLSAGTTEYFQKETSPKQYDFLADCIETHVRSARQRSELTILNDVNHLVQEVTRSLMAEPSREDIEQAVCERLVASDYYCTCWIGRFDGTNRSVTIRTVADIEGAKPADMTIKAADAEEVMKLVERTVRTKRVQVSRDADVFSPLSQKSKETHTRRSIATVPLVCRDTVHGILAVYTSRPDAFGERERTAFATLGEVGGLAITDINQQRLLITDAVVELTFRGKNIESGVVMLSEQLDCRCTLSGFTTASDDTLLAYGTVTDASPEEVLEVARESETMADIRLLSADDETSSYEFTLSDSVLKMFVDAGRSVTSATAKNGEIRLTVEVPSGADISEIVTSLTATYSGMEFVAKRYLDRRVRTAEEFVGSMKDRLSEKQQQALEVASFAGYYEWPRDSTAEEIADSLGVSPPTLHKYLRAGNQSLIEELFDDTRH